MFSAIQQYKYRKPDRRSPIVFQWVGVPPALITNLRYWVIVRSLSTEATRDRVSAEMLDRMHKQCCERLIRLLFLPKLDWDDRDIENALLWGMISARPPTHRIDIGYVFEGKAQSIFWTVMHLNRMRLPPKLAARAIGRFFVSQIVKYRTNTMLIDRPENDEWYLLMLQAIARDLFRKPKEAGKVRSR